jgi:hypothetical protein
LFNRCLDGDRIDEASVLDRHGPPPDIGHGRNVLDGSVTHDHVRVHMEAYRP